MKKIITLIIIITLLFNMKIVSAINSYEREYQYI